MPSDSYSMPRLLREVAVVSLACAALTCAQAADNAPKPATSAPSASASAPAAPPKAAGPDPLSARALADPAITARIQQSIARDPALAGADISVNTDRGIVSLTGQVKTQEQVAVASAHASAQDGVMRVEDHISVQPQ